MFDRFVKGEGAVVIVLKPVDKAIADNDHIYSVASASTTERHNYMR
jgi:polyketide synthase PksM